MAGLVVCLWLVLGPFCGHIVYVTLSLEDQRCCCLVFNNMLGGSCVIRCGYMCV